MKSSVEKLSDTRVKTTAEVPFDELGKEFDAAYKAIAQQVSVPGFRKGKVPRQIIDARFGRGVVIEQVLNDMLRSRIQEACETNGINPLSQPQVEVTKIEDGDLIEFYFECDVAPEIELPAFESYDIEIQPLEDVDKAVDRMVDELRQRFATRTNVDREAQDGDVVTVDLSASVDGKELKDIAAEDMVITVGSGELIAGADEAIKGLTVGDSAEFTTTLDKGDYKGKEAVITVDVKSIREVTLPELDDDFAEMASEYDTLDELREAYAKDAEEAVKADQAAELRDKVLNKALEEVSFELPQNLVKEQVEAQKSNLLNQIGGDERMLDSLLEAQGTTRSEFEANSLRQIERAVRTQLFLDALANAIQPEVTEEEVSDHIRFTAQSYNMQPTELVQQLVSSGRLNDLLSDVRRGKALAAAICKVNVKDTDGNVVDPAVYFGEEEVSDDAEGESSDNETEKTVDSEQPAAE